jgi:sugar phosphate isomerase/epimerase
MQNLSRRCFVAQSSCIAASVLVHKGAAFAADVPAPHLKFPSQPRERIAVSAYSFRDFIVNPDKPAQKGAPRIELKDFAAHVIGKFKVNKIEPWSPLFPSTDPRYLADFREALRKANAAIANIAVDGEHSPYAADADERGKAIAFSKKWVDVAAALGAHSIRTNIPEAKDSTLNMDHLAASLREVADYGSGRNVVIHLENDNPKTEDPFFLVNLVEKVNSPWLHPLPDFCNSLATGKTEYAYKGIDAMFAHAYGICHVRETQTTDDGNAVHADLARTFGYLKRHQFRGYCSMEYDGPADPYQGTAELIERTIFYLS